MKQSESMARRASKMTADLPVLQDAVRDIRALKRRGPATRYALARSEFRILMDSD